MDEKQTDRLVGMLLWLMEHPAQRNMLCGLNDANAHEVMEVIELLEEQEYYELILILLLKYQENREINIATASYLGNRISCLLYENGAKRELAALKGFYSEQFSQP